MSDYRFGGGGWGPPGAYAPGPSGPNLTGPFAAHVAQPQPPSVGVIADAILALSEPDRARLYTLLGVQKVQGPSSGLTTNPKTGKTFKVQAPKERSSEEEKARKALNDSVNALKGYTSQKGYTTVRDGSKWVVKAQDGKPVTGDESLSRLQKEKDSAQRALVAMRPTLREGGGAPQASTSAKPASPKASSSKKN
jgi:gas vesicle protein